MNGDYFFEETATFESPPLVQSPYDEGGYYFPPDPDIPIGEEPASFIGEPADLGFMPSPAEAAGDVRSAGFDWTQVGDLFTRVGQALDPVVRGGRDIAAVAAGRPMPSSTRPVSGPPAGAVTRLVQNKGLLLVGAGVGGIFLLKGMRR